MNYRFLLFPLLLGAILRGNAQDLVKDQGITSNLHRANIGKIIFTSREIAPEQLAPGDFLHDYVLTHKTNLYITAFLGHSLTNYMHRLAPDASVDSLHRLVSGYRWTLFIDDRLIYQSDIQGAPYRVVRDSETVVSVPLLDDTHEWTMWSQFFWWRFLGNGGDGALTEGPHRLRLEIRPHINEKAGDIIAAGELNLTVNRKITVDPAHVRLNTIKPYDGLAAASNEAFDRDKIRELKARVDAGEFKEIKGVVVLKNGKILIEEYFNGDGRDTLHDPRSVGKSFASTMTGIALGEGYLKSVDQPLKDFYNLHQFENYVAEKETIPLKDLMTMSSAFDGDDNDGSSPGNEENMYPTDNWVKFALDLPVSTTRPRDQWHYFTAGAMLTGDILNKVVPGGLEKYAQEKLFGPLHIRYQWSYTPQHVANTAGGIRMRALDFAKYGQLYKNGGEWNGRQLMPKQWVEQTFTKRRAIPDRQDEWYGYFFWNKKYAVGGKSYETWYCTGNGGNKIFVFTDQPLVVVVTASANGKPYAHPQVDRMMTDFILPAVIK